eukprot:5159970-Heterocapsa_arctica.AAC.1
MPGYPERPAPARSPTGRLAAEWRRCRPSKPSKGRPSLRLDDNGSGEAARCQTCRLEPEGYGYIHTYFWSYDRAACEAAGN